MRQKVAGVRSQLAVLETDYTREKAHFDAVHAGLFRHLRGQYQKRDRLRLAIEYRQKFLDSFVRDNPDEVEQAEKDLQQAKVRLDEDYQKMAAAADKTPPLTVGEEAELPRIWRKLVKLYRPDRFAESDKEETYHQLTAAIKQAKHTGDTETLRKIAADPEGFQLEQGGSAMDFKEVEELAQLKRLHETLQKEFATVTESLKELRASPDYELCQRAGHQPKMVDELAAERAKQLELENTELETEAERLAAEIKKVSKVP